MSGLLVWMLLLPGVEVGPRSASQDSRDAEQIKALRSELRRAGVRVTSTYAALTSESKLRSAVSRSTRFRRPLLKTAKELKAAEARIAQNEAATLRLTQTNVELNGRLANVAAGDVATNNRLVGLINANNGQIQLLQTQLKQLTEATNKIRAKANQAREDYVSHILSLRPQVENIEREYAERRQDQKLIKMLEELGKLNGKPLKLQPSRAFQSSVTEIEKLERTVLSDSIPLRKVGKAMFVSVVVNGKAREMIVDSGSTLISLPWKVAEELGVKVKPSDQAITARLADGREIRATRVVLESVRVGGFSARNVEAAVLSPEARLSEPLLGMSFLEKFRFEIRAAESVLTMSHAKPDQKPRSKP